MLRMIKGMSFIVGVVLVLILGFSYGTFIYTSDSYRTTEMLVSNLTYGIDITSSDATVSGKTVNVSYGTTAVVYLKVTSLNKVDTKYGVDYKITKGTGTVKYASNTGWLPTGKISENNVGTYEKVVKVVIAAETDMSVDFTVTGGFPNNELSEVATGYTRITEEAENIISYNDTLTTVIGKESSNNIYGGESTSNYLQYPINDDNTKNIWRILGIYSGIGTKIVSNQVSTTTKSTLSTDLNSFYNSLEKPDNYILTTDKFNCTNTSCTSSNYSKVGLISTSEYEMLGGINSYLASSESYFALDNGTVKNITSGGIEETSTSSGIRPTVYLQDYVTVTGSGTVSDPFKLKMPEYAVVLNVVNGTATLPSKIITRGEDATYEIIPNIGYKLVLSSNTCSNGTLEGNIFTISNVTSAQNCTITLTPESYTLTLDVNGGSVSSTSKTVTYDSTYGELPTPTKTGYTFSGWYTANSGGTKVESTTQVKTASNHTLYANWTINKYTLTLTKGTGVSTIYYKVNGSSSYSSATGTQSLSVNYGSTYTYYGTASTGYTMSSCASSSPCLGTMGTSAVSKTLTATLNKYTVTLTVTNGVGSTTQTVNHGNGATFTVSPNSGYTATMTTNSCGGTLSGTKYTIANVTTNKTCNITFKQDVPTLASKLLSDHSTKLTRTDFSTVLTTDNTKTLYTATENGTTVYYFAGNAQDNWVKFAGYYWRIIRTNADGSIRLLYHSTRPDAKDAYIETSAFNSSYRDTRYAGYMYGSGGSLVNNRKNTDNSTIKTVIDNWYEQNMTSYTKYLSTTAIYCNDRSVTSGTYSTSSAFNYAAYTRLSANKRPTYDCAATEDKFTVDTSTGNGKLTYPIALMTADEVSYAGGVTFTNAPTWYYYNSAKGSSTGENWMWLLSPDRWTGNTVAVFGVRGSYNNPGNLDSSLSTSAYGVRPVTSLKSCVKWKSGDGSTSNPYEIEETTSGC